MPEPRDLRPWPRVRSESVADCRVFTVTRAWVEVPKGPGGTHPFYVLESQPWVNVIPLTAQDEIVMVRQYRHGAQAFTLELPGGLVDPGEEPATAAARELQEESGYRAGPVRPLGHLNPNPALFNNRVHTYLAEGCERTGDVENTGLEETAVELVPVAELDDRVRAGDIDHALVIAALHWWRLDRDLA